MKFKATDFRAIGYGFSAICIGIATLYQTGLIDKAIEGGKRIGKKLDKKEKKEITIKIEENPIIQQAANETYYAECFRNGGYRN